MRLLGAGTGSHSGRQEKKSEDHFRDRKAVKKIQGGYLRLTAVSGRDEIKVVREADRYRVHWS